MHTLEVIINNFILWQIQVMGLRTAQGQEQARCTIAALKVHVDLVLALLTNICIGKRTSQFVKSCNIDLLPGCTHEN